MTAGAQQPVSAIAAADSAVTPPSPRDNGGQPALRKVVLKDFIIKMVMPDEIGVTEYR